jgi:hypothetical protein
MMLDFLGLLNHLAAPFRTQAKLEAEVARLRHQLNVLRRAFETAAYAGRPAESNRPYWSG